MQKKNGLITRRQAIASLATFAAGTIIKPASIFGAYEPKSKTRFVVMGDFGTGGGDEFAIASKMFDMHRESKVEFVLSAGDNIYPNGAGRYFAKNFEQPFAAMLKEEVKFYTVFGNHDIEEGRRDQLHYPLFNMGGSNYYTIGRGNGLVDFFMIDTTDLDSTQMNWLENTLRSSKAIWKIAVFHHPIYSSAKKHGSNVNLKKQLEPLLKTYSVQVVFAGHDHVYERIHPQQGIQHFVTGGAGKVRHGDIDLKSEFRAASYDDGHHFMLIELDETEIAFKAITAKGEVVDSGIIRQS
ncbi:MAG TPA: metallophosphoesterase [Blastocatellia bacterium]|nr:metallophosphoesterase [Blastocatellia bacterium]